MLGTILRIFVGTSLSIVMVASAVAAQTAGAPPPTAATQTQATSPAQARSGKSTQGTFDKLSPGNQKIAGALFDAQKPDVTTTPLTLDAIAQMKQDGKGWGQVFKEMKAQGLLQEKTLGQVVSRASRPGQVSGDRGTTATGRSQEGSLSRDHSSKGPRSTRPNPGLDAGHGGSTGAGAGASGKGGQGVGRGK